MTSTEQNADYERRYRESVVTDAEVGPHGTCPVCERHIGEWHQPFCHLGLAEWEARARCGLCSPVHHYVCAYHAQNDRSGAQP